MSLQKVNRFNISPQHLCNRVAVVVRHLCGAVHGENAAIWILGRKSASRLERHARVSSNCDLNVDYGVCGPESPFNIAVAFPQYSCLGTETRSDSRHKLTRF